MISEIHSSYHFSILKENDKVVKIPKTEMGTYRLNQVKEKIKNFYHPNIDIPIVENGEATSDYYKKSLDDTEFESQELINIFIQLCDAVEHLHKYNIIGIDLKPEHIRFYNNEVKLIDCFEPSTICPKWNAPESILNRKISIQSDIYCIGNIIYYSMYKKLPFDDKDALKYLNNLINNKPTVEESIFKNIILKCLEKKPENRYPSVNKLRIDIANLKQTNIIK
jgi:serine/threonine protein kinase